MSNPNASADLHEVMSNHIYEYVSDKLYHILYSQWFTGFKYVTDPDLMGRILTLKDLAKDHGIDFNELLEDTFDPIRPYDESFMEDLKNQDRLDRQRALKYNQETERDNNGSKK